MTARLDQAELFGQPEQPTAPPQTSPGPAPALVLKELKLRNFKGIAKFDLIADGRNVSVFGDNAAGKTTLFDAYTWLLFGKDSANRATFEVKTLDKSGQSIHGLEHEVEGIFAYDGREIALRKVYAEKWTRQRGSAEKVFTGHSTDHFVDGVPVAKADYERRVAMLADENAFRLVSDPAYFNEQLHWQDRRKILLAVCGDISDADVIACDAKLAELPAILGTRSLDDHRKVLQAGRARINKELEQLPVRISEVQRALPNVATVNPTTLAEDIRKARAARQAEAEKLARAESGGAVVDKQKRLAEVRARLMDIEREHRAKADAALYANRKEIQDATLAADANHRELKVLAGEAIQLDQERERACLRINELIARWDAVDAEQFTHTGKNVCPTCGQGLPVDVVEAARTKALEAHNLSKAQRLEAITGEGQSTKEHITRLSTDIARHKAAVTEVEKRMESTRAKAAKVQADLEKLQQPGDDAVTRDPAHRTLATERDQLSEAIEALKAGAQPDLAGIREEIASWDGAVAAFEREAAKVEQHRAGMTRIGELQAEEKRLAAEYERLEREFFLAEAFTRTKVRLLTDKINSRFQFAKFKLFEEQLNGGLTECCETTFGGVPWGTNLNRGARMNVGLDLINTLSIHYGFSAPVWVDNAEAVVHLLPVNAQLIRLVVCDRGEKDKDEGGELLTGFIHLVVCGTDKTLRVEQEVV
jgi:hypothetical protein